MYVIPTQTCLSGGCPLCDACHIGYPDVLVFVFRRSRAQALSADDLHLYNPPYVNGLHDASLSCSPHSPYTISPRQLRGHSTSTRSPRQMRMKSCASCRDVRQHWCCLQATRTCAAASRLPSPRPRSLFLLRRFRRRLRRPRLRGRPPRASRPAPRRGCLLRRREVRRLVATPAPLRRPPRVSNWAEATVPCGRSAVGVLTPASPGFDHGDCSPSPDGPRPFACGPYWFTFGSRAAGADAVPLRTPRTPRNRAPRVALAGSDVESRRPFPHLPTPVRTPQHRQQAPGLPPAPRDGVRLRLILVEPPQSMPTISPLGHLRSPGMPADHLVDRMHSVAG